MQLSFPARLILGLALSSAFLGVPTAGRAYQAKDGRSEKVRFTTVDHVELQGTFYSSSKGKRAPCVLLLHAIGSDSQQDGWHELAQQLQKSGFAVLSFDFRGHGNSTSVEREFWTDPTNSRNVRGYNPARPKEKISYRDFTPSYHLRLVDDIAAAKLFLDRKNDSGECNTGSLIVVGAEDGAVLGALWMASEYSRYKLLGQATLLQPARASPTPEGKSIAAAVWLSITPHVARNPVGVPQLIRDLGRDKKVPMYFLYGANDSRGQRLAQFLEHQAGGAKAGLTGTRGIEGTNLVGHKLLGKNLETTDFIVKYVDKVIKEQGVGEWEQRDPENTAYVWVIGSRLPIEAKLAGERALRPLPYNLFMGR